MSGVPVDLFSHDARERRGRWRSGAPMTAFPAGKRTVVYASPSLL